MTVGFGRSDDEAMAAGIERTDQPSEVLAHLSLRADPPVVSALCLHSSDIKSHILAANDPVLDRIIKLWPTIGKPTRAAMYALIQEAGGNHP